MVDGGWLVGDDIGVGVGGKVVDGANNPNKKKLVNHGANIRPCINVHRHENSDTRFLEQPQSEARRSCMFNVFLGGSSSSMLACNYSQLWISNKSPLQESITK